MLFLLMFHSVAQLMSIRAKNDSIDKTVMEIFNKMVPYFSMLPSQYENSADRNKASWWVRKRGQTYIFTEIFHLVRLLRTDYFSAFIYSGFART